MRTKVLTDITGESESDALTHSYNGYKGLFENLNFTLPIIPLPTWKEHIDNFRDSIGIAVYGGGPAIIVAGGAHGRARNPFYLRKRGNRWLPRGNENFNFGKIRAIDRDQNRQIRDLGKFFP